MTKLSRQTHLSANLRQEKKIKMLLTGLGSVLILKNCDRGLAMLVPFRIGSNMAAGSKTNRNFYKSVNLSLDKLKNIKIILFLIQGLFR